MNVRILDSIHETKQIHIRSDDHEFEFKDGSLLFKLQHLIACDSNHDMRVSLKNAEIVVSWYNVNLHNNILNYSYDGSENSLVLTSGNYNISQILHHFKDLFHGQHGAASLSINWTPNNN